MSPSDEAAQEFANARIREICDELMRVDVQVDSTEVFAEPAAANGHVQIKPTRKRVGIVVADGIPGLLYGQVVLEIDETYAYTPGQPVPTLEKYSYLLSYLPELLIESSKLWSSEARQHWGDMLLTQRKFFRFDGESQQRWDAQPVRYKNQHYRDHCHFGAEIGECEIRMPISAKPSVLAVACLPLFSLSYERWVKFAKSDNNVLLATQLIFPHVQVA